MSEEGKSKLLIVDDDPELLERLTKQLTLAGFEVIPVSNGSEGLGRALVSGCDAALIDIGLPDISGFKIIEQLRAIKPEIRLIALTGKRDLDDKLQGFQSGADDYVTKPFELKELVARIHALLRRNPNREDSVEGFSGSILETSVLKIDTGRRLAILRDTNLSLTAKEFDLLAFLASHPEYVFDRKTLLESVWGYDFQGYEDTVTVHITRLRSKLESDPKNPKFIRTHWGAGYSFNPQGEL